MLDTWLNIPNASAQMQGLMMAVHAHKRAIAPSDHASLPCTTDLYM